MDSKMSLTIRGIVVMVLGYALSKVDMPVQEERLASFVETAIVIAGAAMAWYARFRQGGINVFGMRKPN